MLLIPSYPDRLRTVASCALDGLDHLILETLLGSFYKPVK